MAIEIPLGAKYKQHGSSSQKSRGGNSGTNKPRPIALKGEKEAAMETTRVHQRVIFLDGAHKRRKITAVQWEARNGGGGN